MRSLPAKRPLKTMLRRIVILVGVPVVAACLTFILLHIFTPDAPRSIAPIKAATMATAPPAVATPAVIAPPVRLAIKSINVDATVYGVGLTSNGDMDISENPDQVAWYQLGPKPGEIGSAVIAGHYGWMNGHGSVFNNLHKLVKGDEISVDDQKGVKRTFVVQSTQIYNPDADATKVFTSNDNKAHLNLVTCEGTWVSSKDSYTTRRVVFADLK